MAANPTLTNNLNRSIGAPPKQLAIVSYVSFIAIVAFFYYVLFVFRFEYQYTATLSVNPKNLNENIIAIKNANNISPQRLHDWQIDITPLNRQTNSGISLTIGKDAMVNNKGLFYIKKANMPIWDNNSTCIVKLSSITFYNRLFDSK
jgi:hypothetical protein